MRYTTTVIALSIALGGCAMTPERFAQRRASLNDTNVCRVWLQSLDSGPTALIVDAESEARGRGLTRDGCETSVRKANASAATGAAALLIGVAAIAAARHGGTSGGAAMTQSTVSDDDWEWDEFRDETGSLVWACRGVQTAQFAEFWHCDAKIKSDWKWPGPY